MFRLSLLPSVRQHITVLAVLLLLLGLAFPDTARAQGGYGTFACDFYVALPADLAELDLEGLQAALRALVAEDPDAMITLRGEYATIRADLLLADEAVLAALLEGRTVNITMEFGEVEPTDEIVAIRVSTAEDCTDPVCADAFGLPASLADLDVAGLRAALEAIISADADAMIPDSRFDPPIPVRADLLLGLETPVLEAVLSGEPLLLSVQTFNGPEVIVRVAVPEGTQCLGPGSPPEAEPKPGDIQDDQQGDDGQDKAPDNQQGGGATVTKTFKLTLHGTVPADQAFSVGYGQRGGKGTILVFCGDPQTELAESQPPCKAGVYTRSVEITAGTTIGYAFVRTDPDTDEVFHSGTETITADVTNTAWYTFGNGTGAGDEKPVPANQQTGGDKETDAGEDQYGDTQDDIRQDGKDKDIGKGADDDKQDDTEDDDIGVGDNRQDDVQDDQQSEMPEEMPETGAGGLVEGSLFSVGNAAAGLALFLGTGYALLRRH